MTTQSDPIAHAPALPPDTRLEHLLIRDLVVAHPATMTILGPLGIDLCCGGGHPLGEALDLHGLDREDVMAQVASVVDNRE